MKRIAKRSNKAALSRRRCFRPGVEQLDVRCLMSAGVGPIVLLETEPNDTVDVAQNLGNLGRGGHVDVLGVVGNAATGGADVDWYRFTVGIASHVNLAIAGRDASSQPILSL